MLDVRKNVWSLKDDVGDFLASHPAVCHIVIQVRILWPWQPSCESPNRLLHAHNIRSLGDAGVVKAIYCEEIWHTDIQRVNMYASRTIDLIAGEETISLDAVADYVAVRPCNRLPRYVGLAAIRCVPSHLQISCRTWRMAESAAKEPEPKY